MSRLQVLLIAGTHGNEINAPWLFEQWKQSPGLINTHDLSVSKVLGNPQAFKACKRYIDCDLNRSFRKDLLNNRTLKDYEVLRANYLLKKHGPNGFNPCQIAIDLHSTTSSMGSSLVVYGRRFPDLAIASLLQGRLGLPVYLHESDSKEKGFLVESWPSGLVVEIGPVPQSILHPDIINQSQLVLEILFQELGKLHTGKACFPEELIVHRHLGSIDFPRNINSQIEAVIHPLRQGADWIPIRNGDPLFLEPDGNVLSYEGDEVVVPVFINEAAYLEKNIAMSFTKREIWKFSNNWEQSINELFHNKL
tara:strand:- start:332 stop:1252 length:921 start_codon:yes stop_codon:yes gene_type:complete